MSDGELNAENEDDLWAAAEEDLVKQREMLKDEAAANAEVPAETPDPPAEEPIESAPAEAEDEADRPAQAAPPVAESPVSGMAELDRILDIPLKVTVELGRSKMLINDLMQLGQGSVIELSKLVGDSLEININGKLIGKGEVVVINEKFGVRLTEIATPQDRLESMT